MPVYARVEKDMILVVREPFPKTAKGSVMKTVVLERHEKELNEMYGSAV